MEWLSASELAGLPGLPSQAPNVVRKAKTEQWQSRDRTGRGGGKEYRLPDRYFTPEFLQALSQRYPDRQLSVTSNQLSVDSTRELSNAVNSVKQCLVEKTGGLPRQVQRSASQTPQRLAGRFIPKTNRKAAAQTANAREIGVTKKGANLPTKANSAKKRSCGCGQ